MLIFPAFIRNRATSLLFSILCIIGIEAIPLQNHILDQASVWELASSLGIGKESSLIEETQRKWLRAPNSERWQMGNLPTQENALVLTWAEKEGLLTAWAPVLTCYDKALIFGATVNTMQLRFNYLISLWQSGVRFKEVIWLTGERPLDPQIEPVEMIGETETDAARQIWKATRLPQEMRALPVRFVAVPMQTINGQLKRPNTADTIIAWLDLEREPCKALFISNQPFCGYQFAVTAGLIPQAFQFDVVGPGTNALKKESKSGIIILDTVARWLYQEDLNTRLEDKSKK